MGSEPGAATCRWGAAGAGLPAQIELITSSQGRCSLGLTPAAPGARRGQPSTLQALLQPEGDRSAPVGGAAGGAAGDARKKMRVQRLQPLTDGAPPEVRCRARPPPPCWLGLGLG